MFFEKKINTRNKEVIAGFLADHFRYSTMISWNGGSSYANNVKIDQLGLSGSDLDKAWEIIQAEDYWSEIKQPIRDFEKDWYGAYTIGSNGRNSGYLVLYEAEIFQPGYKSTCSSCGQLNFGEAEPGSVCGVCREPRVNLQRPLQWVRAKASSIDHRMTMEEYLDMSRHWLLDRYELVRTFDAACDKVRSNFIALLNDHMVVEVTMHVEQKVKRLERFAGVA